MARNAIHALIVACSKMPTAGLAMGCQPPLPESSDVGRHGSEVHTPGRGDVLRKYHRAAQLLRGEVHAADCPERETLSVVNDCRGDVRVLVQGHAFIASRMPRTHG
ncbi:exported hypothetical protein [Micrococcus luteus]|nr:exported hypothetical protein [Micrococcus luteus]